MIIQWILLGVLICFLAFTYIKAFSLKTRLTFIVVLLMISLILMLPILPFSILTLSGLFLFERLWLLMALVLFIEALTKEKRKVMFIFGVVCIIIYFYLRTMI